tara:strand:+ start:1649 stop:1807 length:159 start_codon:yes stop_codon:yes gene_type:complete
MSKDIRVSDLYTFVDFVCTVLDRKNIPTVEREDLAEGIGEDLANIGVYIEPS